MNIRFTVVMKYLFLDGSPFASNSHTSSDVSTLFSLSRFGYTIPFRLKEEYKMLNKNTPNHGGWNCVYQRRYVVKTRTIATFSRKDMA